MGKRSIVRARGRGTMTYRSHSFRWVANVAYSAPKAGVKLGQVIKIVHDPGRNAPIALVRFPDRKEWVLVPEGISTGSIIQMGDAAVPKAGNILPLGKVPDGSPVFNIEATPEDGGKFARSSGTSGIVIAHTAERTTVTLPSKKNVELSSRCRATMGISAGGDRKLKPFVKAGTKYWLTKARGKLYPRVSARSMNAVDHKFGGSHLGIAKTVSRNAPPGRKVGSIAARRTGRKKK